MTQTTTPNPKAMRAILDQANEHLSQPMEEGGAEHRAFMALLNELAQSRSAIVEGGAHLASDLKAFEARLPKRYSDHWHTLVSEI